MKRIIMTQIPVCAVVGSLTILLCIFLGFQKRFGQRALLEAETSYRAAVSDWIVENHYRSKIFKHPEELTFYDYYGNFLRKRGRLREAEGLYMTAISKGRLYGLKNSFIANPMKGLALVYEDENRFF